MTRMFNFELWAEPPPETVGALCARRAHDWMVIDMGVQKMDCYDGKSQTCHTEVCKTLTAMKGHSDSCDNMPKILCFRCGSFGQFVHDDGVSGTLDCLHNSAVGNGTPCLVVHYPAAAEPAPAATTNSNGGHAMPTIAASEWRGPQGEKDRNGSYVLQRPVRATQISGGSNPQVCGTLAARDGFKTGPRNPDGQDAYDGKLIVASFDPYEPGGVKTVRQDGAACTVVNGTCAGWHGAVIQDARRHPQTSKDAQGGGSRNGRADGPKRHGHADLDLLERIGHDAGQRARAPEEAAQ